MPYRGANRSWAATIRCSCGWEGEVEDHPEESSAVVGARAMWILHCFEVPEAALAQEPVRVRELVAVEAAEG